MDRRRVLAGLSFGLVVIFAGVLFLRHRSSEAAVTAAAERAARAHRTPHRGTGGSPPTRASQEAQMRARGREGREGREPVGGLPGRRMEVVSLGPSPVDVSRVELTRELAESPDVFEACFEAAGGSMGLAAAMAASEAQALAANPNTPRPRRPPRFVMFDIAADGTIDPATVSLEPAMPDAFAACFRNHLAARHVSVPGNPDGLRVQMPLNALLQNQPARDGGVH